MNHIKVVGHRGARGLAPENSVEGVRLAEKSGVDFIELDVRYTKDQQLVLCHDRSLYFTCGVNKMADQLTLKQIQTLAKKAGHPLATLQEALDAVKSTPLILELKEPGTADILYKQMSLTRNRRHQWLANSHIEGELVRIKELNPKIRTIWSAEVFHHPIRTIRRAARAGAYGVSLHFFILNLLDYTYARHNKLMVETYIYKPSFLLNSPAVIRLLSRFYPELMIITDRPDKLVPAVKASRRKGSRRQS